SQWCDVERLHPEPVLARERVEHRKHRGFGLACARRCDHEPVPSVGQRRDRLALWLGRGREPALGERRPDLTAEVWEGRQIGGGLAICHWIFYGCEPIKNSGLEPSIRAETRPVEQIRLTVRESVGQKRREKFLTLDVHPRPT